MSKSQVLKIYKSLLKESTKFPAYNFRTYALRRIRDNFKENRNLTDPQVINQKLAEASRSLEIIQRQVIIAQMYSTDKLVIEHIGAGKSSNVRK